MNKYKGDIYELFIFDHLKNTEKYDFVWLWKDIPEKVLFEENIITDYAIYSLVRNDIGIDILAKKGDHYTYVQCKNYTSNSICVLDLAGNFFFKLSYGKNCKVYYNGNLSNRIKLIYPNDGELINIPFNNQIDIEKPNINNDIAYEVRDYQQEAYNQLKDKNRSIVSIPCGMGRGATLQTLFVR